MLLTEFCDLIKNETIPKKQILEFGTGPGNSAKILSTHLPDFEIITIDGFVGLPKTEKGIPTHTEWYEGNYMYNFEEIKNELSTYQNIRIIKSMSWELTDPLIYDINEIIAVNIDFDLYEGTIDALRFVDKCKWDSLLIRFDDWGSHPHQNASEVDLHEKGAFNDWIKETNYQFEEYVEYTKLSNGMQTIMKINRT